jgi:hypothetical protein
MASGRAQLQALIEDLGKLPPDLRRELRPAIKKGARPMLDAMHRNASWSTRIPAATKLTTKLGGSGAGVSIITNARQAPHARVYENQGVRGIFRAPGWGDREHWYPHQARPWFKPAIDRYGSEVTEAVAEAVSTVASRHGF